MKWAIMIPLAVLAACSHAGPVDSEEAAKRAAVALRDRLQAEGERTWASFAHRVESQGDFWVVYLWCPSDVTGGSGTVWVAKASGEVTGVAIGQ